MAATHTEHACTPRVSAVSSEQDGEHPAPGPLTPCPLVPWAEASVKVHPGALTCPYPPSVHVPCLIPLPAPCPTFSTSSTPSSRAPPLPRSAWFSGTRDTSRGRSGSSRCGAGGRHVGGTRRHRARQGGGVPCSHTHVPLPGAQRLRWLVACSCKRRVDCAAALHPVTRSRCPMTVAVPRCTINPPDRTHTSSPQAQLSMVDVVLEVRDARIPVSTAHPQVGGV